MSNKRSGLGRNLSALLSTSSAIKFSTAAPSITSITLPVHYLQPGHYQPRTKINDFALQDLANSIKQQGVLQPLLVRSIDSNKYEIIAGERRWRASQLAGLTEIPVIIHQVDNETAMAIGLIENLQREDLNPVDQARAMARLTEEFTLTHQEIATLLSKSRASISNFLRLLSLPDDVLSLLEAGEFDMGHARALLTLDADKIVPAAQLVAEKKLSVRETEKLVQRLKQSNEGELHDKPEPLFQNYLEELTSFLQTKVKIKPKKSGKGSLVIHYNSTTELEKFIEKILEKEN